MMRMLRRFFLVLGLVFLLAWFSGCNLKRLAATREVVNGENQNSEKQAEKTIKNSPVLQELDHLCREEIPLFQGFARVNRHASERDVMYAYLSSADYAKVRSFYKAYFAQKNWALIKERVGELGGSSIEFRKDSNRVVLYHEGLGNDANYALRCERLLEPE